ncbi:MAG: hypothetical protein WCA28_07760 [Bradyrhizobium sp.]
MGLFKPRIDKQITDAITSRDRIASRLTEAGIGIADLKAEAERAALSGAADDVLDKVEGKMRALIDRSTTLQAALSASETLVADLTRQRDEAADRKEREEGAASLELMAREAVEAGATLAAAADRLQRIMTRAAPCGAMEANGFINFAAMAKVEIPAGSDLIAQLVRTYRQALLDGRVSSRLPVPPEAFVESPAPELPSTQTVFTLRATKWLGDDGKQQLARQFQDIELPLRLVAKALKTGACVPLGDARRRELHGTLSRDASADRAFDLDAEPEPSEPPLGVFGEPVVSEPRVLRIAR